MSVDLLLSIGGAVALIISGVWAVAVVAGKQFDKRLDERFAAQEVLRQEGRKEYAARLERVENSHAELERAFFKHLAELPRDYMRREDHIRFETVINAKLDALAAQQALIAERLPPRRD